VFVQLNQKEQYWCVKMKVNTKSKSLRMKKIKITLAALKESAQTVFNYR